MSHPPTDHPKQNRPLIWAGVIVGLVVAVCVIGAAALYVTNFNLLEWME